MADIGQWGLVCTCILYTVRQRAIFADVFAPVHNFCVHDCTLQTSSCTWKFVHWQNVICSSLHRAKRDRLFLAANGFKGFNVHLYPLHAWFPMCTYIHLKWFWMHKILCKKSYNLWGPAALSFSWSLYHISITLDSFFSIPAFPLDKPTFSIKLLINKHKIISAFHSTWDAPLLKVMFFIFKLEFTPCKTEQPLWRMELQEKWV